MHFVIIYPDGMWDVIRGRKRLRSYVPKLAMLATKKSFLTKGQAKAWARKNIDEA